MHITWLGQTCTKLVTKNITKEITLLIDPYKPDQGEFPRNLTADVVAYSITEKNSIPVSEEAFVISTLGEFDVEGVIITTWAQTNGQIIYKITTEGMNLLHLGKCSEPPTEETLESFGKIDIILLPVGGNKEYLEPAQAARIVTTIEPRLVIPLAYESDSDPKANPVSAFIKEMGLKPELTDKKLIIKSKDLPQEETKLYILEKNTKG
jgi:L-ascorbate metabolism protein UlaG (beta-lactamase superfamily)